MLGDGTYSLCVKCFSKDSNKEYAVKIIKLDHDSSQEIEALEKCQGHKNVVKLIEKISDKKFTYIVCELLNGGELFNRIRDYGFLDETLARHYFQQIVDVVSFMHAKSIVHRDLKPENFVFVNKSPKSMLKLLDFGFACHETMEESPPCFTLDYAAPESLTKSETKFSRDLWALGVILYTMLCGNTPFKHINKDLDDRNIPLQTTENIRRGLYNISNERWSEISPEAKDLIASLLKVNESDRLSLRQLKKHRWMHMTEELSNGAISDDDTVPHKSPMSENSINDETDEFEEEYTQQLDNNTKLPIGNREETRSNDDSSSGIVMSERNEGSSVSSNHEEIENAKFSSDEPEYDVAQRVNELNIQNLYVEQEEPENLSMKPAIIERTNNVFKEADESELPIIENESVNEESVKMTTRMNITKDIPKQTSRRIPAKKTEDCDDTKTVAKSGDKLSQSISSLEEPLLGFNDSLIDGFPTVGFNHYKENKCLTLYSKLFDNADAPKNSLEVLKSPVDIPKRRGRKKKDQQAVLKPAEQKPPAATKARRQRVIKRKAVDNTEIVPQNPAKRPRGRPRKEIQIIKLEPVENPIINTKPKRSRKKVEQVAVPIVAENKPRRGRKRKLEVDSPPRQKNQKMTRTETGATRSAANNPEVYKYSRQVLIKPETFLRPAVTIFQNNYKHPEQNDFSSTFWTPVSGRGNISNYVDNKHRLSMIQCKLSSPMLIKNHFNVKREAFEEPLVSQHLLQKKTQSRGRK